MNPPSRIFVTVICSVASLCGCHVALAAPSACDQAWAEYNEFKQRNVMEPSQYALTVQGANVRANCGANALPAPPGSDTPPWVVHRPIRPPEKPRPPKPTTP